ncbi:DOMON domain-containing protein frrs1L [Sorochytrium milnesiophthora]
MAANSVPLLLLLLAVVLATTAADTEYRSITGARNNPNDPTVGVAGSPYASKVGAAPLTVTADLVANTRIISNTLADQSADIFNVRNLSSLHNLWGNFICHDISHGQATRAPEDQLTVTTPANDTKLGPGVTMSFSRRGAVVQGNTRSAINAVSHFMDGSQLYGTTDDQAAALRNGAYMKVDPTTGLPPSMADNPKASNTSELPAHSDPSKFFAFPLVVANRLPGVQALYVLFLQEHNRYVDELKTSNGSSLNDEQLYQRARNWVIGLLQHYTYYEYLPLLLGKPLPPYTDYDPTVQPNVDVFFDAVSFRYAHSEMGTHVSLVHSPGNLEELQIKDHLFDTDLIQKNGIVSLLAGLAMTPVQEVDIKYSDLMRNQAFGPAAGMDMLVFDLVRARELGISSYKKAAAAFSVQTPQSLASFSTQQDSSALAKVYNSMDDVDAIIGGLFEDRNRTSSNLGPLFAASISDQFRRLRDGDRFWHERPGVLTDDELARIRGTPLRDVILRNLGSSAVNARANAKKMLPRNMWQVQPANSIDAGYDDGSSNHGGIGVSASRPPNTSYGHAFNDRYKLYWRVEDAAARFVFDCGYRGWCAFGFGKSMLTATEMYVAHLVPGGQNATVSEYHPPTAYGQPQPPVQATAADGSAVVNVVRSDVRSDGFQVEFTRPLKPGNGRTDITNQQQDLIFAYQPVAEGDGWFSFHSENRGTMQANLVTGAVIGEAGEDGLKTTQWIHGICMIIAWCVLSPIGIFMARHYRTRDGWVLAHTGFQSAAGIIAIIAAVIAFCTASLGNSVHGLVGLAIFVLLCMQLLAGFLNLRRLLGFSSPASSTGGHDVALRFNRLFHRYTGRVLFLATLINIPLGINFAYPIGTHLGHPLWIIYFIILVIWATIYGVFEVKRVLAADKVNLYSAVSGVSDLDYTASKDHRVSRGDPVGSQGKLHTKEAAQKRITQAHALPKIAHEVPHLTWADIDHEVQSGAMWVVGSGMVYDVSRWIASHPGGRQVLHTVIGTDITTDFFNNVLYDQSHFKPFPDQPSAVPDSRTSFITMASQSSLSGSALTSKGFAHRNFSADQRITATDWRLIIASRQLHFHSKSAIAKLQTLIVGRMDPLHHGKFERDEYRRYALTAKEQISAAGADAPVYKLRFCLLYPNEAYDEEPLFFLPGQAVQLQVRHGGKLVSRYFTPINGNMTMFEAIVKCLPRGEMSALLRAASVGRSAYKIRGPYGSPLINPARALPHGNGCWDNVVCIGVGSGITPFLQLTSWYFLQTTFSLTCRPNTPTHSNELAVSAGEKVFIKYPMADGWVFCKSAISGQEGFLRLSKLVPWIGHQPRVVVVNAGANEASLIGNDSLMTVARAYPEQFRLLNRLSSVTMQKTASDVDLSQGRVDEAYLEQLLQTYWVPSAHNRIMLCGPESFLELAYNALVHLGLQEEDIIILPAHSYLVSRTLEWQQAYTNPHPHDDLGTSTSELMTPPHNASQQTFSEAQSLSGDNRITVQTPTDDNDMLILPSFPVRANPNTSEPEWYFLPPGDAQTVYRSNN